MSTDLTEAEITTLFRIYRADRGWSGFDDVTRGLERKRMIEWEGTTFRLTPAARRMIEQ